MVIQSKGDLIDRSDTELLEALRERMIFLIAEKYSQSPDQVRHWSDYDVGRASMNLQAEGEYKLKPDDIKDEAKRRTPMGDNKGFLLDQPYTFWKRFITEDGVDGEAMTAAGYNGEGQVEWITTEMGTLGWLGKEGASDTAPLPETEATE